MSGTDSVPDARLLVAFQQFVGEIFRLNGELLHVAEYVGGDLDLSVARWQIMGILFRFKALTVADIARQVGLRRQSVQQTVNRLREQGLVEATPNPKHKTAPLFHFTVKGHQLMPELLERQAILTQWFTDGGKISTKYLGTLSAQLVQLRNNGNRIFDEVAHRNANPDLES
jgi:DNA-binding MarR family transcriptional regulator